MTAKLNFRSALFLLLPALVLTFGCKDMKLDIQDSKDRLDVLEGTTITTINEQISAINTSISDLKEIDETLDAYIKALETTATDLQKQINDADAEIAKVKSELGEEISSLEQSLLNELNTAKETIETELLAINNTLVDLKQADEALDKKISDLQTYVDTELASTKDWANATFSTLTQYEQTQTEISSIKASIEQINAGMAALETRLNGKIAADIQTAVDALRSELSTDYITRIENAVSAVTQAYTTAISSAKDEITTAYTAAIATAIAESETNMQAWVNTVLTQGYYDIATIDGKLSALSAQLDETDADLQKQIEEQRTALEASKEELTKAYKNAIKEAIEENNGVINAAIAEAVQNLEDKIQARLTVIDTNISNIQKQIANISKDITSIYEQIAGITSSISDLQDVDKELDAYIKVLESKLSSLENEFEDVLEKDIADLKALIQALQAKDIELQNQISALQTYIDTKLQETADWAESTFATLEQYSAIQTEISAIKTLINKTKSDITEEYTAAIETAISNSETGMRTWVNTLLAQGYYTISDIDGKVSALEALIADGDNDLQKQIDEQKSAIETSKEELTKAYKNAIKEAIEQNNGVINAAIAEAVQNLEDNMQARLTVIETNISNIQEALANIQGQIEGLLSRIQSISYIPRYEDGKATVKYSGDISRVEFEFEVSPKQVVSNLLNVWSESLRIKAVYTETRAISFIEMPILNFEADIDNGIISIVASGENLSSEFYFGNLTASASLSVSDGNCEFISEYIPLVSKEVNSTELGIIPNNQIWYKTADNNIVTPSFFPDFSASVISNTYIDGKGVIEFDSELTSVGSFCFSGCNLVEITLPNSITSIGESAFQGCKSLKKIDIPNGVSRIGGYAFAECISLTRIKIPNNVTAIGQSAFRGCSGLAGFWGKFATSDNRGLIVNGVLISFISNGLIEYVIPNDVTTIGEAAFEGCKSLQKITLPNSLTKIGAESFSNCESLQNIVIPDAVGSIGSSAFKGCASISAFYGKFASLDNKSLIIDDVLIAYAPKGNDEYVIPNNVTKIDNDVFYECDNIKSISVPSSVSSIGVDAFYNCTGELYIDSKIIEKNLNNSITWFNETMFSKVVVGNNIERIGEYMFAKSSNLTSIVLPNSITAIGPHAFSVCRRLKDIAIPNSVTIIGEHAFIHCESLEHITIPDSVTSIGHWAFSSCTSLVSVILPSGLTELSISLFDNCTSLNQVTIPSEVTSIHDKVFKDCANLKNIIIPDKVKSIGSWAFENCVGLSSVVIPKKVELIGSKAFEGCENLSVVYCNPATPPKVAYHHTSKTGSFPFKEGLVIYVPRDAYDLYVQYDTFRDNYIDKTNWYVYESYVVGG